MQFGEIDQDAEAQLTINGLTDMRFGRIDQDVEA
jgi:hypothetical protein